VLTVSRPGRVRAEPWVKADTAWRGRAHLGADVFETRGGDEGEAEEEDIGLRIGQRSEAAAGYQRGFSVWSGSVGATVNAMTVAA
jgi:hypothetical protein